jgi:tetratricopeptide (TPR) repeat protein
VVMVESEQARDSDHAGNGEPATRNAVAAAAVSTAVQAGVVHGGVHVGSPLTSVVPRQLPTVPGPFAGRVEELAAMDQALDAMTGPHTAAVHVPGVSGATVVISAIGGAGGIGKTWLAVRWANRQVHRFTDGQLFIDLRGFSPTAKPVRPGVAVRGFLDALGVEAGRIPKHLDAQAALYRSMVAGKRMLVLLDNAASTDQVIPLLPGTPTCTVLVTSRVKLDSLIDRYGARHLQLGTLTRDEARALLAGRLGQARIDSEPGATEELIALCGHYPLALSIAARHAHTRPSLSLAEIVSELRALGLDMLDSDSDPAASLPTVLSWSLRSLKPEHRRVFTLLGVAPGPDIAIPAAGALTDLSATQIRKALLALEDASLLDRHAHGRYAMHDLIRGYAATANTIDDERTTALRRTADFYLHTADAAHRLLDPHAPSAELEVPARGTRPYPLADVPAALAWFDDEHANLLAVQQLAIAHDWHEQVWHLARALDKFHAQRGHRHDGLISWQAALDAAAHLPNPAARIHAQRSLGDAYSRLERHDEAIGHLSHALELAKEHNDPVERAHTHRHLAIAWGRQGKDQQALEQARRSLALYRTFGSLAWEALELNAVGWYAARLGDYDTARTNCQAALALHQRHHNVDGEAHTLGSLGWIDHHTGHHQHAIAHYRQAIALFRDHGDIGSAVDVLADLGHPHAALGQLREARAVWRESLGLYRQLGRDTEAERVRRLLAALDQGDSQTGARST